MNTEHTGGTSGLRGYEYQITVTVWLGLKLLLETRACRELEIEPASQEDIAAKLNVSPEQSTGMVGLKFKKIDLDIQVKSRRGAVWTKSAFKSVLKGKPAAKKKTGKKVKKSKSGKPAKAIAPAQSKSPRTHPLERLKQDSNRRYLFITDAQLHSELSDFSVTEIGNASSAKKLPVKLAFGEEKEIAPRLGVIEQMSEHRVALEIKQILSQYGHVQPSQINVTIDELKAAVRRKLLKESAGPWKIEDLEGVLKNNSGMPSAPKKVIFPLNIEDIRSQLGEGAVILSGQSGTGKTILAELLEYEHRMNSEPFEIITAAKAGVIRKLIQSPGRHLFFLEDPWGHYQIEADADHWRSELPKLLSQASPEKRFLITTRSAVEELAFKGIIPDEIKKAEIVLRNEDYSTNLRKEILETLMQHGKPWQVDFAKHHADEIVAALKSPYSIDRLTQRLKQAESPEKIKLADLIKQSAVETVSTTLSGEIEELGENSITAAIALWTLFTTRKIVTSEETRELGRSIKEGGYGSRLDTHSLLMWLKRMGYLIEARNGYSMHPTVMEGLEALLKKHLVLADEIVSARLRELAAAGDGSQLEILAKQIKGRQLAVPAPAQTALNRHLLDQLRKSDDPGWGQAFRTLATFSTSADPIPLLVKSLNVLEDDKFPGFARFAPGKLDAKTVTALKASPEAKKIAERFIRDVLFENNILAGDSDELVNFFKVLEWDFSQTFYDLAKQALKEDRQASIGLFVEAALQTSDRFAVDLTTAALDAQKAYEDWINTSDKLRTEADQDELDADYAAHVLEEGADRWYVPGEAVKALTRIRRQREGFDWIVSHPRRKELLWAWAETIDAAVTDEELSALRRACGADLMTVYWEAASKARRDNLAPDIAQELKTAPQNFLKDGLRSLSQLVPAEKWEALLEKSFTDVAVDRKLELVSCGVSHDLHGMRHDGLRKALFSASQAVALGTCYEKSAAPVVLDQEQQEFLAGIIPKAPEPLALAALGALGFPQGLTATSLPRLLKSKSSEIREGAIHALNQTIDGFDTRAALRDALADDDYRCRALALRLLAIDAKPDDMARILAMHMDPSTAVRRACAEVIGMNKWSSGIPVLLKLMYDTRNVTEGVGLFIGNNAEFAVARAAATAFSPFPSLSKEVLDKIIECIEKFKPLKPQYHMPDSGVPYQLLLSIGNQRDISVADLFLRRLWDDWYVQGYKNSGYPLRIASAFGLVCQLVHSPHLARELDPEKVLKGAEHDDDRFAGFCLITAALMGARTEERLKVMASSPTFSEDRALLLGAVLSEESIVWETLRTKFPGCALLKKFLDWAGLHKDADTRAADAFLASNLDIQAWFTRVQQSGGVFPQLRIWLNHLFAKPFGHLIKTDDALESHLPEGIPLLKIVQPRRN
jgi:hypothetical protein